MHDIAKNRKKNSIKTSAKNQNFSIDYHEVDTTEEPKTPEQIRKERNGLNIFKSHPHPVGV